MNKGIPLAILVVGLAVAAAVVYSAETGRYQAQSVGNGMLVRLDTRTGATDVCIPQRASDGERYVIPCNGRRGE